jgi:hypothetical protein
MYYKNTGSQHSDLMMEGGEDDPDGMGGYAGQAPLNNSGTARSGKPRAARGA